MTRPAVWSLSRSKLTDRAITLIRIAEVTPNGYRPLTDNEVASVSAANAALNQNLRSFFLTGGTP
jgi:hypothetical protein